MGYRNIQRVYLNWGPFLKDRPMRLYTYMALISRDEDMEPWYGEGHEALARFAVHLAMPAKLETDDDRKAYEKSLRVVRRHITPLIELGAIETSKRATFGHFGATHVRYRLYFDGPSAAWLRHQQECALCQQQAPSPGCSVGMSRYRAHSAAAAAAA